MTLRLLYIHQVPLSEERANVIQVVQMCRTFQKLGVEVTLALPKENKHVAESHWIEEIERKMGKRPNFAIRFFPGYALGQRTRGLGAYIGARSLLREYRDFDFCFARSIFLLHLALRQGFKVVYESHHSSLHPGSRVLNWIYNNYLLRDVRSDNLVLFLAISESLAEIWRTRGVPAHKILTLHDGVSAEDYGSVRSREDAREDLGIEFQGKLVVYAGSLYEDRGIDNILRLAEVFPEVMFYVVGGPERAKEHYKKQSQKRGLRNIILTGHVPNHRVREYLFASDVLLMLWSSQVPTINICSPLKVFEYMASGRIIVGFGFPTIKEILVDNETAFLARPDVYEDLESKLRQSLMQNYPNRMAEKARKIALNKYSWENRVKTILNHLKIMESGKLAEI